MRLLLRHAQGGLDRLRERCGRAAFRRGHRGELRRIELRGERVLHACSASPVQPHGDAHQRLIQVARCPARRHPGALRQIPGFRQRDEKPRIEGGTGQPAHVRARHHRAAQLPVADPGEEGFDQRVAGRERVDLLVLDGEFAPEGADYGPVLREIEAGKRVHFQLRPDTKRNLAGHDVHLDVDGEPYPLRRLDGDRLQPHLQRRGGHAQRSLGVR